jgi:hypothetical protein
VRQVRIASRFACILALLAVAGACGGRSKTAGVHPAPDGWKAYGAGVESKKTLPVATVLESPQKYAGKTVTVEGEVSGVCLVKGCWMTMQSADREMRVHFKDYGFFVPMDCAGRTARIEGVFNIETIPVEEARHYLEDAGKPEEAAKITEPVDGFTFVATGVLLRD